MKFGLHFQVSCADWQSPYQRYQDTLDQIQLGDELGFDTIYLAEMHFTPTHSITPAPLLVCAAAAQRTERIRLGVAINLLPLHHPIRLAEDVAELDIISNGRVEFGVGRANQQNQYLGFDIPIEESRERMVESLEFIVKAWTHDRLTFDGKYYSANDLPVVPKPLQRPHPPIRMASNSPDSFDLVGKLGYAIHATPIVVPMLKLRDGVDRYRKSMTANGHPIDGSELSLQIPVFVASSPEKVRTISEPGVTFIIDSIKSTFLNPEAQRLAATVPAVAELRELHESMTYDRWCDEIGIYGDPDSCIERIRTFEQDFKPWEINCQFNPGGMIESPEVMESFKLFAEEVMPHFR